MNLKSIKLVGFKSFVDHTVIPMTGHLTGIVGPNGCGKSNVVDAIRWVIGETSAKQLRGQSMADVIFNGTSSRKPVSKASVELIFDNSDNRLVGEYARFSEISVRREVHREGQSQYLLNGASCRRRDIIDVFLGTGLGSRSYAIVEQGMISQLIEAKPDEMRMHLEEVAGISKYKERRRETETRMRHTQENLDRLNDLNEELSKQLRHLKRQAEAAEKYTELKQQERTLQAEIKVLQWQILEKQAISQQGQLTRYELQQEEYVAQLRQIETHLEKIRLQQVELNSERNESQKNYYGFGAEVARLEQRIAHNQEQINHWKKELVEVESLYQELEGHTEEQRQNMLELDELLMALQPQATEAKAVAQESGQSLLIAEQQMQLWQQGWDTFQTHASQFAERIAALKTNLQHYQQQEVTLQKRNAELHERQQQLPLMALTAEIEPLITEVDERRSQLESLASHLEQISASLQSQRLQNTDIQRLINQQRQDFQNLQARFASLEALQKSALGLHDDHTKQWLSAHSITDRPRLAQVLQVNPGWELAVETVLGGYFDAVCLQDINEFIEPMTQITRGRLTLIDHQNLTEVASHPLPSLAAQIQSQWPVYEWLSGIYTAEHLADALRLRSQLAEGESIITRDGIWLGKNWVRITKAVNKDSGILVREQELKHLTQEIEQAKLKLQISLKQLEQGEEQLHELEEQRDLQHRAYKHVSSSLTEVQTRLSAKQSRFNELHHQQQRLAREISESEHAIKNLQNLLERTKAEFEQSSLAQQQQVQQREVLISQRDQYQQVLKEIRHQTEQKRQAADELAVRLAASENQLALLKQSSLRDQRQRQQLSERRELLIANLEEVIEPLADLREQLQFQLSSRLAIEQELRLIEERLLNYHHQFDESSKAQQDTNEKLTVTSHQLQNLQMERQAVITRQTTIQEQLLEQNLQLMDLLAALPANANINEWEKQLATISARIGRLGSINLAAIDECQAVSERKIYLDKQQADLNEALDILKSAIAKIDRETRTKFQETFTTVNQHFQDLFPQIFGGGKASLELSEEDGLTAGVIVKAQPPGKRNATIYMLSGGEKALTAIALVFSMFKLNPAPFCVLDEVDAPLDDVNVGRFCHLVKEMAKTTQFIIISHNKVTISMSDRLMGVTMQEAGVSRIVSVNVAEAVAMAE